LLLTRTTEPAQSSTRAACSAPSASRSAAINASTGTDFP
jgi:hypothetical protein